MKQRYGLTVGNPQSAPEKPLPVITAVAALAFVSGGFGRLSVATAAEGTGPGELIRGVNTQTGEQRVGGAFQVEILGKDSERTLRKPGTQSVGLMSSFSRVARGALQACYSRRGDPHLIPCGPSRAKYHVSSGNNGVFGAHNYAAAASRRRG